jgi:hypothetical protein
MRYYVGPWVLDSQIPPRPSFWRAPIGAVGSIDLRSIPAHDTAGIGFFTTPDAVVLGIEYTEIAQGAIDTFVVDPVRRNALANALNIASVSGTTLLDCLRDILTLRADATGVARWKPLMPTAAGNLEIHLGGHSLIWQEQFNLASPEAANVIAVVQNDYRRIHAAVLRGETVDTQVHRRVLDALGEKYRVSNPEDFFIPADLPKEKRLPHSTIILDTFDRADQSNLGTSSEGWSWTNGASLIDIVGNVADSALNIVHWARADSDLSSADHYAQCVVAGAGGLDHGPTCRKDSTATNTAYNAIALGTTIVRSRKVVAGSFTTLADFTGTVAAGDTIKIEANGSTIKAYQNGIERTSSTDTAITGNLRCGILGFEADKTYNNFEAADSAGEPPGVNAPKQRSRGFNLQQMADAEDEGRFNELDVRNWWREAFA